MKISLVVASIVVIMLTLVPAITDGQRRFRWGQDAETKELAARLNEIGQLESILEKVTQNNIAVFGKMSVDKTTKIENTIVAIKEKVSRIQQQLQALEPEIELQKKATIKVTRAIYPNAVLTINDTTKRFSTQTRGNTWVQSGDELVEQKKKEESHAC